MNSNGVLLDAIRTEAIRQKVTPYRLAKQTGLSTRTVYDFFQGKNISYRTVEKLMEALNLVVIQEFTTQAVPGLTELLLNYQTGKE